MPIPLLAYAAVALAPSIYKGISGALQKKKITNATDPGYQVNNEAVDNARILGDQYSNYTLPGYGQALSNIDNSFNNAYASGVQGAGSGDDVLDLATKMAYGKTRAISDLSSQVGQGRQQALMNYLNAKAASGQQSVDANAYERQRYMQELQRNAALEQASAQNTYGAIDDASTVALQFMMANNKSPNAKRWGGAANTAFNYTGSSNPNLT